MPTPQKLSTMTTLQVTLLVMALVLPAAPVWGQEQDAGDPALAQQLQAFQQKIQAGDLLGAIVDLEELRDRQDAPPQLDAILGGLYAETGEPEKALELLAPLADAEVADPAVLFKRRSSCQGSTPTGACRGLPQSRRPARSQLTRDPGAWPALGARRTLRRRLRPSLPLGSSSP